MLAVNSSLKWEIHLIPHKSPSVESALLYQSFQRTFLQHFSEGLINCAWRKGCVFLHRFLCVHLPVLIAETECNLHKSRVGKRGYEDCCCLPLISKMESMAIVRKGLWEGVQPWQPTTAIQHLLNESQLKVGICLEDCNPLRQKHTDKLFTKTVNSWHFKQAFQAKNKTFFVLMKMLFLRA